MQESARISVHAVKAITHTIGEINDVKTAIKAAIEQQGEATGETRPTCPAAARVRSSRVHREPACNG